MTVLRRQTQKTKKRRAQLTFIAVSNRIKVDVVLVVADEEEAEPRIEGINWHNEQDADDVALLIGDCVGSEMCVDLQINKAHENINKQANSHICSSWLY